MDEVIDDLISLESGFNDGGLDCMEPNIILQNNVSMNYINTRQCWLKVLTLADGVTYLQPDFQDPPPKHLGPRGPGKSGELSQLEVSLSWKMSQSSLRFSNIFPHCSRSQQCRLSQTGILLAWLATCVENVLQRHILGKTRTMCRKNCETRGPFG